MSLSVATGIVVAVYLCIELIKRYIAKTDKQQDMLPIVGVLLGVVFAVAIFYLDKGAVLGIYVGDNLFTAIITGGGSGLIATGGNQLFKKIAKLAKGDYEDIDSGLSEVLEKANDVQEFLDNLNSDDE